MREILRETGQAFIEFTSDGMKEVGIDPSELTEIDHICYRVETLARYNEMFEEFQESADLVAVNKVNGRDIATFELHEPFEVDGKLTPAVELPEPKAGTRYPEGWEHVECVTAGSLERFRQRHAELPFSDGDMNKLINPELGLKVGVAMGMLVVKFHQQSLISVAGLERRLREVGIEYDIRLPHQNN